MAPSRTTTAGSTATLRVPTDLRDAIARMAERRGTSMVDVVSDAVRRVQVDDWWSSVRSSLDDLTTSDMAAYRDDANRLDAAAMDGLRD